MKKIFLTLSLLLATVTVSWGQTVSPNPVKQDSGASSVPYKRPTNYDPKKKAEYDQLVADIDNLEEYVLWATDWVNDAYVYFDSLIRDKKKVQRLNDNQKKRLREVRKDMPEKYRHKKAKYNGVSRRNPNYEKRVEELLVVNNNLHAEEDYLNGVIDKYEKLYLGLVNNFFKEPYTSEGHEEAKKNLDRVNYDEAWDNFHYLMENYLVWLYEIGSICQEAEQDYAANPRSWTNPHTSQADTFIKKLDNCQYSRRADKDWSVSYFDELIKQAKARIAKYKTKQTAPLNFDDILPSELPKKEPKAIKKTPKPVSNKSSVETTNGKVTGVRVH